MKYKVLFLTLTVLTLPHLSEAKRPVSVELRNLTCLNIEASVVSHIRCEVHKKRSDPSFSVNFSLLETVRSFNIVIILDIMKRDGTKLSLTQVKMDGCKFLNSINIGSFYGKFFRRFQIGSTLPTNCPVSEVGISIINLSKLCH
ncbi:uncharacterized protein LOC127565587 [Drosophila albomicans]|uniref:Uncharacterized protein LOC127565587 n=1 Tax=Drosophila albomicans TaxID=7291 RepID=A0A9C6WII5_DROAB|nr:uncharacterized protein LOC127565587 [Drosophila albomicans]